MEGRANSPVRAFGRRRDERKGIRHILIVRDENRRYFIIRSVGILIFSGKQKLVPSAVLDAEKERELGAFHPLDVATRPFTLSLSFLSLQEEPARV